MDETEDVKSRGREKRRYLHRKRGRRSTSEEGKHNIGNGCKGWCSWCFPQLSIRTTNRTLNGEIVAHAKKGDSYYP